MTKILYLGIPSCSLGRYSNICRYILECSNIQTIVSPVWPNAELVRDARRQMFNFPVKTPVVASVDAEPHPHEDVLSGVQRMRRISNSFAEAFWEAFDDGGCHEPTCVDTVSRLNIILDTHPSYQAHGWPYGSSLSTWSTNG